MSAIKQLFAGTKLSQVTTGRFSMFKPFDYQEPMIEHLVNNDHSALFAGCGTGKTACTLEALKRVGGKALVLAPLRVASMVWGDQVKRWGYDFKVANLRTKDGMKAWEDGSADIYTVNLEMVSRGILEKLIRKDMPVDTLIIDELSLCKANSKRTKSIVKHRTKMKRVWGLTGTPSPNSVMDLFYQLKCIDGGERLGKYITHFRGKYFDSDYMGYNFTPKTGAVDEIKNIIAPICLSVQSKEHLDIPNCVIEDIDVKLPKKVMDKYRELEKHLVVQLGDSHVDAQSAATLVNKLKQVTAGVVYDEDKEGVHMHTAKHPALAKILKKHSPVLVLTSYKTEMQAILDAFPQAEAFDEKRMDDWCAGKIPVWVANPASLSHGIDRIQDSCSTIVWMSLTYSLEQYEQTNARILRTGQKKSSTIWRVMAEETIDWAVATALEGKGKNQSALLESIKIIQRTQLQSVPKASEPSCKKNDPQDFWSQLF